MLGQPRTEPVPERKLGLIERQIHDLSFSNEPASRPARSLREPAPQRPPISARLKDLANRLGFVVRRLSVYVERLQNRLVADDEEIRLLEDSMIDCGP